MAKIVTKFDTIVTDLMLNDSGFPDLNHASRTDKTETFVIECHKSVLMLRPKISNPVTYVHIARTSLRDDPTLFKAIHLHLLSAYQAPPLGQPTGYIIADRNLDFTFGVGGKSLIINFGFFSGHRREVAYEFAIHFLGALSSINEIVSRS